MFAQRPASTLELNGRDPRTAAEIAAGWELYSYQVGKPGENARQYGKRPPMPTALPATHDQKGRALAGFEWKGDAAGNGAWHPMADNSNFEKNFYATLAGMATLVVGGLAYGAAAAGAGEAGAAAAGSAGAAEAATAAGTVSAADAAGLAAVNSFDSGAMAAAVSAGEGASWTTTAAQVFQTVKQGVSVGQTALGAVNLYNQATGKKAPTPIANQQNRSAGYLGPDGRYIEFAPTDEEGAPIAPDAGPAGQAAFNPLLLLLMGAGALLLGVK